MQKPAVVVVLLSALAVAASILLVPDLLGGGDDVPVGRWSPADEVVVDARGEDPEAATAEALAGQDLQRSQIESDDLGVDERTELTLRGRVVDRFRAPVAAANVWLDFGRGGPRGFGGGGRDRRVPDPVRTDADGRFAFQGQTFRNLRVTLLVTHSTHAPGQFDRNLGEVGTELDLGELVVASGGELIGRVVGVGGHAIPGAEVRLQPDGENPLRFQRDREQLLKPVETDSNGFYRFANVAAGDWRVAGTARRHENGTSDPATAVDEQRTEVADLVLGPGYELAGVVLDRAGQPVAEAEVTARPRRNNENGGGRGGRGGRGGDPFGNDFRTRTDAQGRFAIDHLPDALIDVGAQKTGYLPASVAEVDPEQSQPLFLTLEDGLRIQGHVTDAVANAPVTRFSVRAQWRRPLPVDGRVEADLQAIVQQMRDGNLDEATRNQLRERMQTLRAQTRSGGGPGGPGGPQGGRGGRGGQRGGAGNDRDRAEDHPGGDFVETGLLEGVYVVQVESEKHAPWRSEEVELRLGAAPPVLQVQLTRGFTVEGIVKGADGKPLADARIELRRATEAAPEPAALPAEGGARGGRGGRGGRMQGMMEQWNGGGGAVQTARTGKDGTFRLEHAPAGRYTVEARGQGHQDGRTEPFALAADVQGVALVLQPLGRLRGRVLGATPEQLAEVRVVAAPVGSEANLGAMFRGGNGGQPFAMVSPDGSYLFAELNPGDYAVRAFVGQGMREVFQQFMGGQMVPDVKVEAGVEANFDVALLVPQTGTVRGSVLHNNSPAVGFQVSLQPQDDGPGSFGPGGPGGFGGRGGRGRNDSARVDEQGRFEIKDVQAGTYRLSVSADRRGNALHQETVVVVAHGASESTISILTSSIEGTVEASDGTAPADLDGNVMLLPGVTEMPQDGAAMRNANAIRARVTDGKFTVEQVPAGPYLAVLSIRGRTRTSVAVQAQLGQRSTVALPLGAVDPNAGQGGPRRNPQQGGAGGTAPGAQPAGGNARPQPGGQRRGG